jgi:hypothetical protein
MKHNICVFIFFPSTIIHESAARVCKSYIQSYDFKLQNSYSYSESLQRN